MGLQKPSKNLAPAYVQPAGGYHPQSALDPCCIPVSTPPLLSASGEVSSTSGTEAPYHIMEPTRH
jgi:hypothetical protein